MAACSRAGTLTLTLALSLTLTVTLTLTLTVSLSLTPNSKAGLARGGVLARRYLARRAVRALRLG